MDWTSRSNQQEYDVPMSSPIVGLAFVITFAVNESLWGLASAAFALEFDRICLDKNGLCDGAHILVYGYIYTLWLGTWDVPFWGRTNARFVCHLNYAP